MTPDQREQMRQFNEHVKAVRIDLSGMLGAGADSATIELALMHLDRLVNLAEETVKEKI